ncbi:hypothetical protein OVA24_19085 [Luteolibacter sp. SL250]|uniref:hypothetical protein n=1 Tax=Luteolibacter sp. SL250 TaxID=2995170 RepID=UPI00226E8A2D|nr:hypothetical protein [Luteolibacter sp. SL250]WAC19335.1 hypothetical protein OVA24_19085 [Luteolibacter sp. SL250]
MPILIAQWIGVVKLSKHGRRGDWWCMVTGTALATLNPFLQVAGAFLFRSLGGDTVIFNVLMFGGLSALGGLLFAIGFVLHAMRLSNLQNRISELEMMNLAQATELERIRNR